MAVFSGRRFHYDVFQFVQFKHVQFIKHLNKFAVKSVKFKFNRHIRISSRQDINKHRSGGKNNYEYRSGGKNNYEYRSGRSHIHNPMSKLCH